MLSGQNYFKVSPLIQEDKIRRTRFVNYKYLMNHQSKWLAISPLFNNLHINFHSFFLKILLHSLSLQRYLLKYLRVSTFIKNDILQIIGFPHQSP